LQTTTTGAGSGQQATTGAGSGQTTTGVGSGSAQTTGAGSGQQTGSGSTQQTGSGQHTLRHLFRIDGRLQQREKRPACAFSAAMTKVITAATRVNTNLFI